MREQERIFNPEFPETNVNSLLQQIAEEINTEAKEMTGKEILNPDATINMRSFIGDPYKKVDDIKQDENTIEQKCIGWSAAYYESVQNHYKEKYRNPNLNEKDIAKLWKQEQQADAAHQAERYITSVLYKFLKDNFLVMRSSEYDDFEKGVDNVIVDRETGDVICAFDEVKGEEDSKVWEKKIKKVREQAMGGGANIKYGVTFENNENGEKKLVKKRIENVPNFYLPITSKNLDDLMKNMNYNLNGNPAQIEIDIFNGLVDLLDKQSQELSSQNLPPKVRANLEKFYKSLEKMKTAKK